MMCSQPNYHCHPGVLVAGSIDCCLSRIQFSAVLFLLNSLLLVGRKDFFQRKGSLMTSNTVFFTHKAPLNTTGFQVLNRIVALVKAFNDNERHFWLFSRTFTRMEPLR